MKDEKETGAKYFDHDLMGTLIASADELLQGVITNRCDLTLQGIYDKADGYADIPRVCHEWMEDNYQLVSSTLMLVQTITTALFREWKY